MSFARSTLMWGSGGSCNSGDKTEWDGKRMPFYFPPWKAVSYVHFTSLKYLTVDWMMWNKVNAFDFSVVGLFRISHRYPEIFSQPRQSPSWSVQDSSEVFSFCDEDLSNPVFTGEQFHWWFNGNETCSLVLILWGFGAYTTDLAWVIQRYIQVVLYFKCLSCIDFDFCVLEKFNCFVALKIFWLHHQ